MLVTDNSLLHMCIYPFVVLSLGDNLYLITFNSYLCKVATSLQNQDLYTINHKFRLLYKPTINLNNPNPKYNVTSPR